MKYDIRTKETSKEFVKTFLEIGEKEFKNILEEYEKNADFFETNYINKIKSKDINGLKIYGYHFTTNPDNCKAIKSEGIKNLQEVLKSENEFTNLLQEYQIRFDIENSKMYYKDEIIDIYYDKKSHVARNNISKSVARKIYYDYSINGFFYEGKDYIITTDILKYPEILKNIEECIGEDLIEVRKIWDNICKTYKISFCINVSQVNCIATSESNESSFEMKKKMLNKAMRRIEDWNSEEIIYIKDNEQIYNNQIISIETVKR